MTIAELNRKIVVNSFSFSQDASGGNIKSLSGTYECWANVKPLTNSRALEQLQIDYTEAYTVTKRHELSRPFNKTDEIIYENEILSVHGVREITEGKKKWDEITAYSTGRLAEELEVEECGCFWEEIEW